MKKVLLSVCLVLASSLCFAENISKDCALLKGAFETSYGLSASFRMDSLVKTSDANVIKAIAMTERGKAVDISIGLRNVSMLLDDSKAENVLFTAATQIYKTNTDGQGDKAYWTQKRKDNNSIYELSLIHIFSCN